MKISMKKAFSWMGPYPYNPVLIFSFFSACYFSRFIPVIIQQSHGLPRYKAALEMLILAGVPSYIFATVAFLVQKYRRWSDSNLLYYIAEIAFGQSFLFIISPLVRTFLKRRYNFDYEAPLTISLGFYVGTLIMMILALGLLHRAELSIMRRIKAADLLAEQLEKDRESLIFSDEELRRQTSQFLHDRVQSDLMVVGMKLKSIQGRSTGDVEDVIQKAILRLESTRASDLRNLVQNLTPNFKGSGFIESLRNLSGQYHLDFKENFSVAEGIESLSENQQLGIFRITEQSLLNSLVHAESENVRVQIDFDASHEVRLTIKDSGPGVELNEVRPGVGSSVIASWVSILKAKQEVVSSPGMGYSIKVTFPK